jgi:hypothetical protein
MTLYTPYALDPGVTARIVSGLRQAAPVGGDAGKAT